MDKTVKFKTVFNGYSKTEVDQYLNELDTQYQNEHLAISRLMLNAQNRSDQIIHEAEQRAAEILAKAEADSKMIRAEAEQVKADLIQEMRTNFIDLLHTAEKMRKTIENSQEMYMLYSTKILREIPLESSINAAVEKVKQLYPQTIKKEAAIKEQTPIQETIIDAEDVPMQTVCNETPVSKQSETNVDDLIKSINAQRRS
ncbi:DivIVA domain-containing protein [Dielma fastidiosa]|uniref:DivIVA domain-containing protein n=1 Tax=Dielma fastidiosa TaxID=1034346 RepID=A0AB35UHZ3_9FIRM|nr:DivIVA domain-containing protein [Dielma fastidiosa]MDY5166718.1 DivIVA domain-containing protein [Dielma fastidiosa]